MPIENERKYVLAYNPHLECEIRQLCSRWWRITQSYLFSEKGKSVRIREYRNADDEPVKHLMTVKVQVGSTTYEIEQTMAAEEYLALKTQSSSQLVKHRYEITGWELDFFLDNSYRVYFVQAEYEMAPGEKSPAVLPEFIINNLLHEVPKNDNRFSNRKLANIRYAKNLLRKVRK